MSLLKTIPFVLIRAAAWVAFFFFAAGLTAAEAAPKLTNLIPTKIKVEGRDVYALGFDKLSSFPYKLVDVGTGATPAEIADHLKIDQVPPWIRVYDHQPVLLTGYMMPLQIENGRSKKFVMMRDVTTCCYGAVPNMNDYLIVTMKGDGVEVVQDVPVELLGTFRIDHRYEGGYVVSLFVMDGEKLLGARK